MSVASEFGKAEEEGQVIEVEAFTILLGDEGGGLGDLLVVHGVAATDEVEVVGDGGSDIGEGEHSPLVGLLTYLVERGVVAGDDLLVVARSYATQDGSGCLQGLVCVDKALLAVGRL